MLLHPDAMNRAYAGPPPKKKDQLGPSEVPLNFAEQLKQINSQHHNDLEKMLKAYKEARKKEAEGHGSHGAVGVDDPKVKDAVKRWPNEEHHNKLYGQDENSQVKWQDHGGDSYSANYMGVIQLLLEQPLAEEKFASKLPGSPSPSAFQEFSTSVFE